MAEKLDSIIDLQPGFKTAVNLRDDLDRFDKCAGYIPTSVASDILLDVGENLHVLASRRARLITGTYGTGKSHLALVLANVYRLGADSPAVSPVMAKLKSKWPGKADKLISEREKFKKPFLLVLLHGHAGPFNDSLLRGLDRSLADADLSDLLPETAFSAAKGRLIELKSAFPEAYARAEGLCRDYGYPSIEALEAALDGQTREAYDRFCEIHEEVCHGAPFHHSHAMEPSAVYNAVAKRLAADGQYAGIVTVWDEFGRYMEHVLDDPSAEESRDIGRFAETCNGSQKHQLHLYLVCHRSLEEYAQISGLKRTMGLSKTQQEDLQKETGRFRQFSMKSSDSEVFELIDQVIGQRTETQAWKDFVARSTDRFDEWTDSAYRLKVFPEFAREQIANVVTCGAYPLHPCAAYALPRVSEKVAQNERTLFTFLSDSGSDTLGDYLHRTEISVGGDSPPVVTADELWNYFSDSVSKHEIHRRVHQKYELASSLVNPESVLEKRIIQALALLSVIQSDRTPCSEDVLAFTLGLQNSELPGMRDALKNLCLKTERREAVLRQSLNGTFNFATRGSDVRLEDKVDQTVDERIKIVTPVQHLRKIAGDLDLMTSIRATGYSDDLMLERKLSIEIVSPADLEQPDKWLHNLGAGEFRDGYALIVICEDSREISKARELAQSSLKHPQILLGIPKEAVKCSAMLRRHEALLYLSGTQSNLYGPGAELREEWEVLAGEFMGALDKLISPIFNPESRVLDWFADGEEINGIASTSRLNSQASDMMSAVFHLTPRIAHERLTTEDGRDNFVATRKAVIDKLIQRDGPEQLHRETFKQNSTVIDFVYGRNGILSVRKGNYVIARPDDHKYPAMAAVWDEIDRFVANVRTEPRQLVVLSNALRKPPYGIRSRCITLLAAAVFREHMLRGNLSLVQGNGRTGAVRLPRMDGAALEQAFGAPTDHVLEFADLGPDARAMIIGFAKAFDVEAIEDREPIELIPDVQDAAAKWWRGLPLHAQRTSQLASNVLRLRDQVLAALAREDSDAQTILATIAVDIIRPKDQNKRISPAAVDDLISKIKDAIEEAVEQSLRGQVVEAVAQVFGTDAEHPSTGPEALEAWYGRLSPARKEMRLPGDAGVLAQHARKASMNAPDLLAELAKNITGTPLENWGDDMINRFKGRLEGAKRTIEEAEEGPAPVVPPPKDGQVRLTVAGEGEAVTASFVPVDDISETGQNLRNILRNSVDGFRKALPSGELETILTQLVREFLS